MKSFQNEKVQQHRFFDLLLQTDFSECYRIKKKEHTVSLYSPVKQKKYKNGC